MSPTKIDEESVARRGVRMRSRVSIGAVTRRTTAEVSPSLLLSHSGQGIQATILILML